MKILALVLFVLGSMTVEVDAAVCHSGVYRTGCAGYRGAVSYRHRYAHYGANRCRWAYGRRVCY